MLNLLLIFSNRPLASILQNFYFLLSEIILFHNICCLLRIHTNVLKLMRLVASDLNCLYFLFLYIRIYLYTQRLKVFREFFECAFR